MKPTVRSLLAVVVLGKAAPFATKDAPQVIARPVALSRMRMRSFCPLTGVPDRLVVIDVMATASAVMECRSVLSVLMVGVAEDTSVVTRGLTRLLVRVWVIASATRVSSPVSRGHVTLV